MFTRHLVSAVSRAVFGIQIPARNFTQMPRFFLQLQHSKQKLNTKLINTKPFSTPIYTTNCANFHVKLKTNKHKKNAFRPHHASVKRYWLTGSDRIFRFKNGMNHKRRRKSTNQLRRLNRQAELPRQHYRRVCKMMGIAQKKFLPPTQSRPTSKFWTPPKKMAFKIETASETI